MRFPLLLGLLAATPALAQTAPAPQVIVTEVDPRITPEPDDNETGEFIEVQNNGARTVDFSDTQISVALYNCADNTLVTSFNVQQGTLPPGGTLLIGDGAVLQQAMATVEVNLGSVQLPDDAGAIALYQGSSVPSPLEAGGQYPNLLDAVVFDNVPGGAAATTCSQALNRPVSGGDAGPGVSLNRLGGGNFGPAPPSPGTGFATPAEDGPEGSGLALASQNPLSAAGGTLRLDVGEAQGLTVALYDVTGRHVATLFDGPAVARTYTLPLDGAGLASGVYLVQARGERGAVTRQITVLR